MTTWQISESPISVSLRDDGLGELAFTVTNAGPAPDCAVLTITALDGVAESWFTVDEPQRPVGPGVSVAAESIGDVGINPAPGAPTSSRNVGVAAADTGLVDRYTLVVDPGDLVSESEETNNAVTVEVSLFGAGMVPCSLV